MQKHFFFEKSLFVQNIIFVTFVRRIISKMVYIILQEIGFDAFVPNCGQNDPFSGHLQPLHCTFLEKRIKNAFLTFNCNLLM